jgi:Tol biopolymer transport system component
MIESLFDRTGLVHSNSHSWSRIRTMKNRFFGLIAALAAGAIFIAAESCRKTPPPRPPAPVDLAGLKPKFEFRGRILFQSDLSGNNEIYLLTRDGLRDLTNDPASDEFPKWSPDGKRIAFSSNRSGRYQIYIMNEDGTDVVQATHSDKDAIELTWFPDGMKIAFTESWQRTFGRSYIMVSLDLASGRTDRLLPKFADSNALPEFSPDARLLGFTGKRLAGWDVYVADLGTGEARRLTDGGGACRPHFSPDGTKIAYVSASADGKGDIWLMDPDGANKERLTERPETWDYFPGWSPDGKYIVFSSGTEHYPTEGVWSLNLVKVGTKRVVPLFSSGARDVFADWR